jgi:thymidylate kinase
MIEGIPGSGKSTTAQQLVRNLLRKGYDAKWWYEEEQRHPVYMYKDYTEMGEVVRDLSAGNYQKLIDKALETWRQFTASVQASSTVVVVDSCLFGYLTWSLFPYNVSVAEIKQYIEEVERAIKPLNPTVIYLYQADVGAALRKICDRRGGETERNFINAAASCPYGKSQGLTGFDGMVAYWESYRRITDEAFQELDVSKIAIDNTEANWRQYRSQIANFLGMEDAEDGFQVQHMLERLTGTYKPEKDGIPACMIRLEAGMLVADGLPQVWARSPLLPWSSHVFHVQSLPFQVKFLEENPLRMRLTGPTLLGGAVDYTFIKVQI